MIPALPVFMAPLIALDEKNTERLQRGSDKK